MPLSNLDFRCLFGSLPTPLMVLDHGLNFVEMNEAYLAVTRRTRDELIGHYVFEAFPETPARVALFGDAFRRALRGEVNTIERAPFHVEMPPEEGGGLRELYWTCCHAPLRDADGNVTFVMQHAQEVTEQVRHEELNKVMARELEHRVKNVLSVVTAIGHLAGKSSASVEDFLRTFNARLQTMARTYTMLIDGKWEGIGLATLVEDVLAPYREHAHIELPSLSDRLLLKPDHAQALSMALHELATNAAKYGALSQPDGVLNISWQGGAASGQYAIFWRERMPTPIRKPERRGFGSTVIEEMLPRQISAVVDRDLTAAGLDCTIRVPTPRIEDKVPLAPAGPERDVADIQHAAD